MSKHFVTGGAGFIGSHLVDRLLAEGGEVTVFDNFSSGSEAYLKHAEQATGRFHVVRGDAKDSDAVAKAMRGHDVVYHLAANPDVRLGESNSRIHVDENVLATHAVLEAMRQADVGLFAFTSTSTVYGEASVIPTPENYGPLEPISLYGASKLAAESLASAFAATYDLEAVSYRFANVVGPRSNHGVTYDFYHKLKANPRVLEILGDGRQLKSYCHVHDVVEAMIHAVANRTGRYSCFNIGSEDAIDVFTIARIVAEEMELPDVEFRTTGGVEGGRGWKGDVKVMRLAIDKLAKTGWKPRFTSDGAIRDTIRSLVAAG